MRSSRELTVKCAPILGDKEVVDLVQASSSVTSAYEMVMAEIKDEKKAKAARFLAMIRRDHPADYYKLLSKPKTPNPSQVTHDTAKGEN